MDNKIYMQDEGSAPVDAPAEPAEGGDTGETAAPAEKATEEDSGEGQ